MAKKTSRRQPYERPEFPLPPGFRESVVVELRYEAPVAAEKGKFVGSGEGVAIADRLNEALDLKDVAEVRPSFAVKSRTVKASLNVAAALPAAPPAETVSTRIERTKDALTPEDFFKTNFARVILKKDNARELAGRLKRHDAVWDAYVAPVPQPPIYFRPPDVAGAGGPFNLEPTQGYLYSTPDGIGACDVWDQKGARGEGITICDIEGGWNLEHEDLPRGIKVLGGMPLSDPEWFNHGTAVLGEMVSLSNPVGTVGIAHRAKAAVQSAFTADMVFNAASAIDSAASKLKPGDVILIELHAELHENQGDFVAMQYYSEVFTAIRAAVNKGIVVVEAAGNGNQDFGAAKYKDTGLRKDSGAIVVGAGVPPTNRVDFNGFGSALPSYAPLGAPRSRIFFSNYGQIVNLQGWGWHVTSAGYGDAGGATVNSQYTLRFSGTSSASPIVTAAVACLQGRALQVRGQALTPTEVRKTLIDTGTPQAANLGAPVSQNHIGPQPDLVAALKKL